MYYAQYYIYIYIYYIYIYIYYIIYINIYINCAFCQLCTCRNLKDFVHGQLAAKAETSIVRLSRCVGFLMELKQKFDEGLTTSKPMSDHHTKAKTVQDIQLVVNELMSQQAFKIKDGRYHSHFRRFKPLLHEVDHEKLVTWINRTAKYILHDQ